MYFRCKNYFCKPNDPPLIIKITLFRNIYIFILLIIRSSVSCANPLVERLAQRDWWIVIYLGVALVHAHPEAPNCGPCVREGISPHKCVLLGGPRELSKPPKHNWEFVHSGEDSIATQVIKRVVVWGAAYYWIRLTAIECKKKKQKTNWNKILKFIFLWHEFFFLRLSKKMAAILHKKGSEYLPHPVAGSVDHAFNEHPVVKRNGVYDRAA